MEKITLLLLSLIFLSFSTSEDSLEPEEEVIVENIFIGIERITSQSELEEFGSLNYTVIEETLILGNQNPCTDEVPTLDLWPQSSITEIYQGGLVIEGARISSLSGLNNLEFVGRIRLFNVWGLQNFERLAGLQTIGNSQEDFMAGNCNI